MIEACKSRRLIDNAELCAMLDAGVRPAVAAQRLGLDRKRVAPFAWRRRNGGNTRTVEPPRFDTRASFKIDEAQLAEIDRRAKRDGIGRSEMIRQLIEWGLEAK